MAANMTDDLLNDGMDFMLSQVAENISFFFLLKLKILEAKVKFGCDTHMTTFSEKNHDFFKSFRREQTVFHFIFLKKMENLKRFFRIFEVRGGNFFSNVV
jgi:hypothetical protein